MNVYNVKVVKIKNGIIIIMIKLIFIKTNIFNKIKIKLMNLENNTRKIEKIQI